MNIKVNGRYYPVVGTRQAHDIYEVQYKHSRGVSTILLAAGDIFKRTGIDPKIQDMKKKAQQKNDSLFNSVLQREFARDAQMPLSPKMHYAQPTDLIGFRYNKKTLIGVVSAVELSSNARGECTGMYTVRVMCGKSTSSLISVMHRDVLAIVPQLRVYDSTAEYQYGYDVNLDYGVGYVTSWEDHTCTDGRKRDVTKLHLRSTVQRLLNLLNVEPEVHECYPILNG